MAKSELFLARRRRLANLLAQKRESMGITQDAFGAWIGSKVGTTFSFAAIQRWENPSDTTMPRSENLRAIALAFGVTVDELNAYLDDPSLTSISQASKSLVQKKKEIEKNPELIRSLIGSLPIEEQINTFQWLSKSLVDWVHECENKLRESEERTAEYEKVKQMFLNNSAS